MLSLKRILSIQLKESSDSRPITEVSKALSGRVGIWVGDLRGNYPVLLAFLFLNIFVNFSRRFTDFCSRPCIYFNLTVDSLAINSLTHKLTKREFEN